MRSNAHSYIFTKTWSRLADRYATSIFQTITLSTSFYSELNMMQNIQLACENIHQNYFFSWRIILANHRRPYSWTVICTHLRPVASPSVMQSVWLREPQKNSCISHFVSNIFCMQILTWYHLHCQLRAMGRYTSQIYLYIGPRNVTGPVLRYTDSVVK